VCWRALGASCRRPAIALLQGWQGFSEERSCDDCCARPASHSQLKPLPRNVETAIAFLSWPCKHWSFVAPSCKHMEWAAFLPAQSK
jgi:hypothetical protein